MTDDCTERLLPLWLRLKISPDLREYLPPPCPEWYPAILALVRTPRAK